MQNKHLFMLIPSIIKLLQSPNIAEIASRLKHQEMAKMNARRHLSVLFCFVFCFWIKSPKKAQIGKFIFMCVIFQLSVKIRGHEMLRTLEQILQQIF